MAKAKGPKSKARASKPRSRRNQRTQRAAVRPGGRRTAPLSSRQRAAVVRYLREWNPARIRSAITQAESGNLTAAVGLCDFLLQDERVAGALNARVDALLGLTPTFEASGDARRSKRALRALEAQDDWSQAYPKSELRQLLIWALLLGVSVGRHRGGPSEDHEGRWLPKPEVEQLHTLRYVDNTDSWYLRDRQGNDMLVEPGDGSWVVHAPFGLKRPWLYGLWYSLARLVLLKYYGIRDSGRLGERAYLLVASAPDSAMQADRDELANDLAKDGAAVVALAPGYKLESVKLGEDSHEIYETQVEMANQAITILIRGGNLTTNTQGGSRAAAEVQERTGDGVKLAFDAETLAETLHEQSLVWWAEFNFGDRKLAPWPSWPVEPEEDKKQRSDMIVQLGTGLEKLEQLGFEIDGDAVIEDFDLTFIKRRKSDDERAADAQKKLEQQQAMQPAGVPGKQPPEPAPGKNAKQRAGGFSARLASGASSVANSGFVAGQLYADAIVDNAVEHANESLEQTITLIGKAIDESTDYEDLRARLKALFGDVSTEELNELVYRTMLLAEMAGRKAVTQDA